MADTKSVQGPTKADTENAADERRAYEAPRITKKRSVARTTLLTGTGSTGVGAISSFN